MVRGFYEKVVDKMLAKFPFGDTTLQDIAFLNPKMKHKIKPESGKFFYSFEQNNNISR